MDGENNGKPYEQMDDLGGKTHYFRKPPYASPGSCIRFLNALTLANFTPPPEVQPVRVLVGSPKRDILEA